jgi:hypothetical protein
VPVRQTGATGLALSTWEPLFDLLDAHPALWANLRVEKLLPRREGRPRMAGEWSLAYLAYVNSRQREMTRWLRETEEAMWTRAGFLKRPGYQAVYEAFIALEAHEAAFAATAAALVKHAVAASDGKVGHAVHIDGTEAETHSRLIHDCTGDERKTCKRSRKESRAPLARASPAEVREDRHREAAEPEPDTEDALDEARAIVKDERGCRVLLRGCWYRLSDADAGVRAYNDKDDKLRKAWSGYYNLKATDHFTGGVLSTFVCPADTNEHIAYPELYKRVKTAIGAPPRAVVADRGFSITAVFAMHTRDGVASVIPWRGSKSEPVRKDKFPKHDRHGIPRCKHCKKSQCDFYGFQHDTGPADEPRLWYRCSRPTTADCRRMQSVYCKEDWRLLLPLWRTTETYQVLRAHHSSYERVHDRWRERYCVAGDSRADRPKRRGLAVQQLRSTAALIIEWLTINHSMGWLPGSPCIVTESEKRLTRHEAATYTYGIKDYRQQEGLILTDTAAVPAHHAEVLAFEATSGKSIPRRPVLVDESQRQTTKQVAMPADGRSRPRVAPASLREEPE